MLNEDTSNVFNFSDYDLDNIVNFYNNENDSYKERKSTPKAKKSDKSSLSKVSTSNIYKKPNSNIIIEDDDFSNLKKKQKISKKINDLECFNIKKTIDDIIKSNESGNKLSTNLSSSFSPGKISLYNLETPPKITQKKRKRLVKNTSHISISSSSSIEKENKNHPHKKKLKKATNNKELFLSLNTTCSICLEEIKNLANPNNCNHDFCRDCLIKWSKNCSNTCPLCKKPFHKIFIYDKNKRIEIKVERKRLKADNEYEGERREDCYVCGKTNNERKKIVCSMCNYNVCHYTCDGLKEMPRDRWYCRDCKLVIKEQKSMRKKIGRLYVN